MHNNGCLLLCFLHGLCAVPHKDSEGLLTWQKLSFVQWCSAMALVFHSIMLHSCDCQPRWLCCLLHGVKMKLLDWNITEDTIWSIFSSVTGNLIPQWERILVHLSLYQGKSVLVKVCSLFLLIAKITSAWWSPKVRESIYYSLFWEPFLYIFPRKMKSLSQFVSLT